MSNGKSLRHKIALFAVKYYPPLAVAIMSIHVALLLLGFNYRLAEYSAGLGVIPMIVLYCVDVAFGFCRVHRLCLVYTITVSFCIEIQRYIGFGKYLTLARLIVFVIGVLLIMAFVHKHKSCHIK